MVKSIEARPQASFLPLVEDVGTVKVLYQRSLHKTLAIIENNTKDSKSVPI